MTVANGLRLAGLILGLGGMVWMGIIGFYPSDYPAIVVLILAACALFYGGQKMEDPAKR